jgi:hypothetical protein
MDSVVEAFHLSNFRLIGLPEALGYGLGRTTAVEE